MKTGVRPIPRPVAITVAAALVLLTLAVGLLDLITSVWISSATVYAVLILGSLWVRDRRYLWGLVTLCLALLFAPYAVHPDIDFHSLINRFISSLGILGVGLVCSALTSTWQRLEDGRQHLLRQNDALENANQELAARDQEIARQNMELIWRQHMLEHLLDLSRSLTVDLGRDEMMGLICKSLARVINGSGAAAIQERRGREMVVVCHHGFGPQGPDVDRIPLERSFAASILRHPKTAYVEDLSLRPDLKMPQPREGEPFVAVVAAPLRVRGEVIGTLEVFSRQKQNWNQEQAALIESLAAQTSISLEAAQLYDDIEQERGRFMAIFRALPIGVAVCDIDPHEIRINPAAAVLLDVPADVNPMTPQTSRQWKIFHGGRPVELDAMPLPRAVREGVEITGEEYEIVFTNGRRLSLLVSAAPIRQRDGRIVGAVSGFADVTGAKRLEEELDRRRREAEESSIRKTRFLAAVSHDIRTPANAINLLAELVRRSAANPDRAGEIPELAGELQSSATALVNLVTDVLDLARFDTGKLELNETEVDLSAALAQEVRQLLPLAQAKGLELQYIAPSQPMWVLCDRIKIGRIVANLLGNAIKFTHQGAVTLELTHSPDRRPRFTVSDTGVGIDAEHLPRIFDEFFQLRNPERDPTKGTGLGLTICKRLVDAMGGRLDVQSEPGRGTTFIITLCASCLLPRVDESPSAIPPEPTLPPSDHQPLRGVRVLLVEDHAPTRGAANLLLQRQGALVAQAATGTQAVELARQFDPHVLLLDMMLPDMIGTDVLRDIRRRHPPALRSIIIMTGDVTDERIREIQNLDITAFLPKPIQVADLVSILIARHTIGDGDVSHSSHAPEHADD